MPKKPNNMLIYLTIAVSIGFFIFLIKSILLPFLVAIIIAYFLDPVADKMEKMRFSRSGSVIVILAVFLNLIAFLLIIIVPLLYGQLINFINTLPSYFNTIIEDIYPKIYNFSQANNFALEKNFYSYFDAKSVSDLFNFSGSIVNNVLKSGIVILNIISLIFITPILVFYMLRDWDIFIAKVNNYLPSKKKSEIITIFQEIDKTLSGYIHGQFNVCLILGIFYALGLTFAGLNFGFLIGFLTGIFSFVPYVGMLFGVVIAIIVALFQWGFDPINISWIVLIFAVGQVVEGNFLTPKLVGDKVGLHPVWIIFGLFVFGILFGFIGILLAMPATAICGVLIKFFANKYKKIFVQ